jgi:hypothetical protein
VNRWGSRALLVACAGALLTGCAPGKPHPVVSVLTPVVHPHAPIPDLVPAEAVAPEVSEHEGHPAVRELRTTEVVVAWADLVDSGEFAQFTQHIDPSSGLVTIGLDSRSARHPTVPIGPTPAVVLSVAEDAGVVTVQTCQGWRPQVMKADGSPYVPSIDEAMLADITLSPLSQQEAAELATLGLEAPEYRVRHYRTLVGLPDCGAVGAVVQEFAGWRDVAPIGEYRQW